MPIYKMSKDENGRAQLDSIDTGERMIGPSERARLQMFEDLAEREAAEKQSQSLVQPYLVDMPSKPGPEKDEVDRSNEEAPRSDVVSVDRIKAATGGDPSLSIMPPQSHADETEDGEVAKRKAKPQAHKCPDCGFIAKSSAGLASHMNAKHREPDPEEE